MTQRTNHPQIATARANAPVDALRAALLLPIAAAALILVLVLIIGPTGAEYGFV